MFDIGWTEILLVAVVAVLVIGPKDMPLALRTAGRWIGKMRKLSGHFRSGLDAMVREAELEDMEKKWKAQNEKIMREHPDGAPAEAAAMEPTGAYPPARAAALQEMSERDAEIIAAKKAAAAEDEARMAAMVEAPGLSPANSTATPPAEASDKPD
ncbi:Sec-independent protein translocase protein TatB [Aurantiacibacter luteus]|uniref:Sec-independent protein translocase protein TatB n=1 Tax=Aurantiacibacter luteus TaxID=1581420 RepID=UPI0009E3BBAC|nr:Sec-independent protein translocase protein TatB [Aurantiacibacter luteus]